MKFGDKRYHSLNYYLRNTFGCKVIKISLDAGLTCPNRDGTLSNTGCIFCGGRGSGDYAFSGLGITEQFELYRNSIIKKWPRAKYIAYFQAYSNTYGNIEHLRQLYNEAIDIDGVVALSIATRPDCLGNDVLDLLREMSSRTKLFVELGFQTSNCETVKLINRCYENEVFINAVKELKSIGANVVCHIILGLPCETKEDMLNTVNYAVEAGVDGIKFHELFVVKNTILEKMYIDDKFNTLEFDEFVDLIISCIEIVPKHIVIHRLTGDAPRKLIVAPMYSLKKFHILNEIDYQFDKRNTWQSRLFDNKQ